MGFEKSVLKSAAAGAVIATMASANNQPDAVQKGLLAAACLGGTELMPIEKIPVISANKAVADVFVATVIYCIIEPIAIGSGQALLPQFLTVFAGMTMASYGTDVVFSADKAAKRVINVQ
jgi:hypothetical protein